MSVASDAASALRRPRVRIARFESSSLLWLLAAGLLILMVVVPLAYLVALSLQQTETGRLTGANYVEAFSRAIYLGPIANSLVLAASVATAATLVGTPVAWLVARTDVPARGLLQALVMAAFVTPSFLGAEAWILLAAPNSGWLNRFWVALTHDAHGPFNIFTLPGAIFVMACYSVPYTFTFVSSALELMGAEMEDAAAVLGASPLRTTLSITLPLAAPAIIAGFIMSFLEALAEFGTPAFILIPARTQVMTTQLYEFFQFPVRVELAAAYAMPLLGVTVALLAIQRRLIGRRRYTTVGGKSGRRHPLALGRWRWPALALGLIAPLLSVIVPYAALLATSLSRVWSRGPVPGNLTLYWYRWAIVDNQATQAAIVHSFSYAAAAATIATFVAALIAFVVVRRLLRAADLLGFLCMAPFVVPGIVLAIGFYAAYSHKPLLLYGTAGILIVAFATRFLPIAYSNITTIIGNVHADLENAARTLGASRVHALLAITAPLVRRGLLSSWLLVFIPALRELSCAIFLFTPRTALMTTVIFDFTDAGNFEAVSTMAILILVITLIVVTLAYRFLGRDFARRTSGEAAQAPQAQAL